MLTRYCIYCGVESTPENPVVGNVCLRCRIKRGELVRLKTDRIKIDLCKICYSVKIGYKWVQSSGFEDAISLVVREVIPRLLVVNDYVEGVHIRGYRLLTVVSWHTLVELEISGVYGGKVFTVKKNISIYFNPVKCPRCIMYDSREFEAVLQLRGYNLSIVEKIVSKEITRDKRLASDLIDVIKVEDGVDIYFYTHGAARKLARRLINRLGGKILETYEETGTRSGKQRARLYISLRKA